ncbi:uncharacterized protein LOC141630667 [Silene latifolia]|uniref:uncharacterized protein LOC141630667 n=1 Tax=Silene latifolia TaxID=37657 RepID=UPI003D77830B
MDTDLLNHNKSQAFKLEAWTFDYVDCLQMVKDAWFTQDRGLDGIPALFFQKYWFHVKSEVTDAVLAMLNSGLIPSELNSTLSFWFQKIIVLRRSPIIVLLVSNGFIPGRSITDNILISHELFHHISKNSITKKGSLALKVDMSKAYDRLRWNFIRATLTHMGFPPSFICLIMNCVQSVTYEVIINGSSGKAFKPHTANITSCRVLRDLLEMYCCSSGQAINADKSAISFSPNCTLQFMEDCFRILKVPSCNGLGRYLGLPTNFGISKRQVFAFLIEKGAEFLKDNLAWEVGCPSTLDIWRDNWIHGCSLTQLAKLSATETLAKPPLQVSSLQHANGNWNANMITAICGTEALPFILSILPPSVDDTDELFWKWTGNGRYSIKSAYAITFAKMWDLRATIKDRTRLSSTSKDFCKGNLWSLPIPNKWKVFLWKIISNTLPCGKEALQ